MNSSLVSNSEIILDKVKNETYIKEEIRRKIIRIILRLTIA